MSGFKEMVFSDVHNVFLNTGEFAERRTIRYDGETYESIPVVMTGIKQKDRHQLQTDHIEGLFLATSVLHCAISDLGGKQPEKGCRLSISKNEGSSFFLDYYVASSVCEMGMLRIELEDISE